MLKVHAVANYFLTLDEQKEGDGISNLKLQKLVYYAQGFHLAIHHTPLFDSPIEAWTHGPVVPALYQSFKSYGSNPIPYPQNIINQELTDEEKELIDEVFDVFGQFSAWKLRNMTHDERPWMEHESDASVIPLDTLSSYFKTQLNNG